MVGLNKVVAAWTYGHVSLEKFTFSANIAIRLDSACGN